MISGTWIHNVGYRGRDELDHLIPEGIDSIRTIYFCAALQFQWMWWWLMNLEPEFAKKKIFLTRLEIIHILNVGHSWLMIIPYVRTYVRAYHSGASLSLIYCPTERVSRVRTCACIHNVDRSFCWIEKVFFFSTTAVTLRFLSFSLMKYRTDRIDRHGMYGWPMIDISNPSSIWRFPVVSEMLEY